MGVIIPSIRTCDIDAKLELTEKFVGKRLKEKTPIGKQRENTDITRCFTIPKET